MPPKAGANARGRLLTLLALVKVATTDQCRALITPNAATSTYILRAANDLARQGLLDSVTIGREQHKAWFLTRAGTAALNQSGLAPRTGRSVKPFTRDAAFNGLTPHALGVTQVLADLAPAGAEPVDWEVEVVHRWLPGKTEYGKVQADAVLSRAFSDDQLPPVLMVEFDRRTEGVPVLARKLLAYREYARAKVPGPGRRSAPVPAFQKPYPHAPRCPPILLVLDYGTEKQLRRRAAQVIEAVAEKTWWSLDIGVVLAGELTAAGPLAPIVTRFYAPDSPVPLARLSRRAQDVADEQERLRRLRETGQALKHQREQLAALRARGPADHDQHWGQVNFERETARAAERVRAAEQEWNKAREVPGPTW